MNYKDKIKVGTKIKWGGRDGSVVNISNDGFIAKFFAYELGNNESFDFCGCHWFFKNLPKCEIIEAKKMREVKLYAYYNVVSHTLEWISDERLEVFNQRFKRVPSEDKTVMVEE